MSLRNVASSVAFCCARAPTNVSNPPANASATYRSQRHSPPYLAFAFSVCKTISVRRGSSPALGLRKAADYWPYPTVNRHNLQEASSTLRKMAQHAVFADASRHWPVNPASSPNSKCTLHARCVISLVGRQTARCGGEHGTAATCWIQKARLYGDSLSDAGLPGPLG